MRIAVCNLHLAERDRVDGRDQIDPAAVSDERNRRQNDTAHTETGHIQQFPARREIEFTVHGPLARGAIDRPDRSVALTDQQEAIDAISAYFEDHKGNPLLVLPTAAGKALVLSAFSEGVLKTWPDQRILVVTHVRELIAQAQATVKEAQANLARFEEVARLSGGKVPSAAELDTARAAVERAVAAEASARANVASARATLATDETNLSKASIRSPIDGVVLTRSVDPGNAVAASLQAVTLFTVAEDLAHLQLQVNVDEADVGSVQVGQKASFTVSAYPSRQYPAKITRVAYGSTKTDNVVTYISWLQVDNSDLSLRPGMTAAATITSTERNDVLLVPNTALRFTPVTAADTPGGAGPAASSGGGIMSQLMPRMPRSGGRRGAGGNGKSDAAGKTRPIWVLQDGGPKAVNVTVGISDGRMTEVSSDQLQPGMAVITDQRSSGAAP